MLRVARGAVPARGAARRVAGARACSSMPRAPKKGDRGAWPAVTQLPSPCRAASTRRWSRRSWRARCVRTLTQDYDLRAVYMRNWSTADERAMMHGGSGGAMGCEWQKEWHDVEKVCRHLGGLPLELLDLSREYWLHVFEPAVEQWTHGTTPNPDVDCNRYAAPLTQHHQVRRADGPRPAARYPRVARHRYVAPLPQATTHASASSGAASSGAGATATRTSRSSCRRCRARAWRMYVTC